MFLRAIVPCFDERNEYVVGYMGRSLFDKCQVCNYYHPPKEGCPVTRETKLKWVKWKSNAGFNAESYLYNLWNFPNLSYAILVEGAGCVWKLEQRGIKGCLALFETKFTNTQREMLCEKGIKDVVIVTDNDEAGNKFRKRINETCKTWFRIINIIPTKKDVGDMDNESIKQLFRGVV